DRPYQVVIFVGAPGEDAPAIADAKVADLTVVADAAVAASAAPDAVAALDAGEEPGVDAPGAPEHPIVAQLRDSGLTPADMRSKALFLVSADASPAAAV